MRKLLFSILIATFYLSFPASAKEQIPRIIYETDMDWDYDDAAAFGMLIAMVQNGEAHLLGVMHNAPNRYSAGFISASLSYYGCPNVPIGVLDQRIPNGTNGRTPQYIVEQRRDLPRRINYREEAEDAVTLYRRILTSQPDKSVTIVSVGFLDNLRNLLNSGPDDISPLNGIDLVRQKVKEASIMGGNYPYGPEFNFSTDISEYNYTNLGLGYPNREGVTAEVLQKFPSDMVFSGWSVGKDIRSGWGLLDNNYYNINGGAPNNPIREHFIHNGADRPGWDQTSVLYAVRGAQHEGTRYWNVENFGYNTMSGRLSAWNRSRDNHISGANHAYLIKNLSDQRMQDIIEPLVVQRPKGNNNCLPPATDDN